MAPLAGLRDQLFKHHARLRVASAAAQTLSLSQALRRWPHACELTQSFGSEWAGRRRANRVAEKIPCLFGVARGPVVHGCGDPALVHTLDRIYRGQRDGPLGELRRNQSCAPRVGVRYRRAQGGRDSLVRPGGGDREMAGALFEIDVELGEPAVEPTPPMQRHRRVAGRGEQWMREVDPVAVELDDALLLGHLDVVDNGSL